jgi:hypothetical protein
MAALVLRTFWNVEGCAPTSSRPSSLMLPVICVRLGLCRPRTAMLLTDLPEPDSPTMARVRPRRAWYVRLETALTTPSSVGKATERSLTSSTTSPGLRASEPCEEKVLAVAVTRASLAGR